MPCTVLPTWTARLFSVKECHITSSYRKARTLTLAARLKGPHLFLQVGQRFCCNGFEDWADAAAKDDRREEEEVEESPPWAAFTGGPSSHSIIPVWQKRGAVSGGEWGQRGRSTEGWWTGGVRMSGVHKGACVCVQTCGVYRTPRRKGCSEQKKYHPLYEICEKGPTKAHTAV